MIVPDHVFQDSFSFDVALIYGAMVLRWCLVGQSKEDYRLLIKIYRYDGNISLSGY